ncbi:glycoside hydrolase family 3 N-terminal domain-containing protein, partial [Klebsiella pneumoniae]|uniref:glycoside hydrolase family 3 N-terminal domain-containing protein n=1 Tax=Klebsiella pneumoniae TaxID=573 RepID=UPI00385247EA
TGFVAASRKAGAGIPILFGVDAVHGHSNLPGATIFPHNIGLGAAHDPALVQRIGAATAAEIAGSGIAWTFAPTLAVPQDLRWGRSYEGYAA